MGDGSYRTDKTGGYIKKIAFNNGTSVDVNKNDIVIFVGPNNAGKSQALKDIYSQEVGGHGPEWVNKVIETYPDLSNGVYDEAKRFIQSMNL